jgi:hypothetical protein
MQYVLPLSLVLCLGLLPGRAWASAPRPLIEGDIPTCVVDRGMGTFNIPTHESVITALHFPGDIRQEVRSRHGSRHFKIRHKKDTLLVAPRADRRDAALSVLILTTQPAWKISLYLHATDDPNKALKACRFVARDVVEVEQQRIDAAAEQKAAGLFSRFEAGQQKRKLAETVALIKGLLYEDAELVPMVRQMRQSPGSSERVSVQLGRAVYHEGDLWTSFFVEHTDWQPLRLANVQLANKDGTILPLRDVFVESPARSHAEALAEVPAGHRVTGLMRLPGVAEGAEPLAITFTGFTGARMVVVTAEEPIWVWVPRREDELKEEQRRKAAERAAQGVVTLSLQGVYGAIWLGDGAGLGKSDATSMKGLGVRAQYAFNRYIAVEGEAMGARTGNAQFSNVEYEGTRGDLARRASLGRAQFGGVLRLSEGPYVPLLRLGVGLQGASHRGTLTTATGEVPGPDAFEFDLLWYIGAGLDARFGPLVAGVTLGGASLAQGDGRSFEAGMHLGYRWNP